MVYGWGITEVVVVKAPFSSLVTITTPESVSLSPSAFVVVQVLVYVVYGGGMTDVVVVKAPSEPVVTTTTPDSVSGLPLASVVVNVVV